MLASTPVPTAGATDRDVLVALYHATNGDNWRDSDNWLSDAPLGTWYGVNTDDNGRVIELVLWFNNLSGTIPPELGDLTALTELRLNGNQLRGTIPPELGNLTALTSFNLSGNQLSGTIPPELGHLSALTSLNLSDNQLSGTVPPELGNLANLDVLYLAGNRLTGCQLAVWKYVEHNDLYQLGLPYCAAATSAHSPASDRDVLVMLYWSADGDKWTNNDNWLSAAPIGTWYGVTTDENGRVIELRLGWNQLSGTVPAELGNLTALTYLSLGGDLSGTIPTELGNLTALTHLNLGWNQLTGTIPTELGNLTTLTELSLGGNQLTGTIPAELGNLTSLTELNLRWNQLSGTIPPELGNLTALASLGLEGNQLSGTIPTELGNLTSLTELNLRWNQLSGCLPAVWKYVVESDLDQISLEYCAAVPLILSATAARDRDLLVALYWATDGENWRNSNNWLTEAPMGMWHGVTTNESGQVIELDLWYNSLSGAIPPELGNLTSLETLILASNELNGTIPPELGDLINLESLQLWNNQLSGPNTPRVI